MSNKINNGIWLLVVAIVTVITATTLLNTQALAQTANSSNTTSTTNNSANSKVISDIKNAIDNLNKGDSKTAKKDLLTSEDQLEGKPGASDAEKHIEASLQALKDGDNKGAITHAQGAIDLLNK